MSALVLVVVLGVAIVGCGALGPRLGVPTPVVLLVVGVGLGFVPALGGVGLPPEVMLLVFLPVLLYADALETSLRDLRTHLSAVVLASTVLVVLTAAAVASAAHALGMAWGPAWVLGAALAPTDATALGALGAGLPRGNRSVLRAESLVNDGTALVLYGLAVGATTGEVAITPAHVAWSVVLSYAGGLAVGALVAWSGISSRRLLADPVLGNVAVVLLPFAAYLGAEAVGASGVLAVVVCGLVVSRVDPRVGHPVTRTQSATFLSLSTYLLNAALFVLIGLQVRTAVAGLAVSDLLVGCVAVAVVAATLFTVRLAFLVTVTYATLALDRRGTHPLRQVDHRARVVNTTAAFRGAVSLAVALSVPATVVSGAPFPDRDLIVFITAGVVATTLLVQGLALPRAIAWAHLPADDGAGERDLAERVALEAALAALPEVARHLGTDASVARRARQWYEHQRQVLLERSGASGDVGPAARLEEHYAALRRALLSRERAAVLALRDERRIDDGVLRTLQARLDAEELRLSHDTGEDR